MKYKVSTEKGGKRKSKAVHNARVSWLRREQECARGTGKEHSLEEGGKIRVNISFGKKKIVKGIPSDTTLTTHAIKT